MIRRLRLMVLLLARPSSCCSGCLPPPGRPRRPTTKITCCWRGPSPWSSGALSAERGARRDEWLIAAIAVVGRGTILTLLVHLALTNADWPALWSGTVLTALTACTLGQAVLMARRGPMARAIATTPTDEPTGRSRPLKIGVTP